MPADVLAIAQVRGADGDGDLRVSGHQILLGLGCLSAMDELYQVRMSNASVFCNCYKLLQLAQFDTKLTRRVSLYLADILGELGH
jgi:hypothetical protein